MNRLLAKLFPVTDEKLFKILGRKVFLRNGVGWGWISGPDLYDNAYLELGFGRVRSGYGDWGGGFDHATACPLKITIDKEFVIRNITTESFYNSRESQKIELMAKKLMKKLPVGSKLIIKDKVLLSTLVAIFDMLPIKVSISCDILDGDHHLKYITEAAETKQGTFYERNVRDSNYKKK